MDRRRLLRDLVVVTVGGTVVAPRLARAEAGRCIPTRPDVQGPFFVPGAPTRTTLAAPGEPGEAIRIAGSVRDRGCRPIARALLDVWQADASGAYHGRDEAYRLRAQLLSQKDGSWSFDSIRPGHYRLGAGFRPAHIHFTVTAPGFQPLTTQLYFQGDPYLAPHDACSPPECHSDDPGRIVALARTSPDGPLLGSFDVVLASES